MQFLKATQNGEITFVDSLSVTLLCPYDALQMFFCHAGNVNMQEYVPLQIIFTVHYLSFFEREAHTDALCSAALISI